jgi:oligopeptide/dipeptide ABC transporter ATP-binding protein
LGIGSVPEEGTRSPAPAPAETILDVRNLHTHFRTLDGLVRAVDGVSFSVAAGASVGIVGESGSGKSVTSLSIMRLVEPPGQIARGEIVFKGRDLASLSPEEMRKIRGNEISMVFQEPMTALNPVYSVGDQVAETVRVHSNVSHREAMNRAIELFKLVGIPAPERRIKDHPHNMSGGMRQRVMIAIALANNPDLLILDEPTTALDVTIQAQILELVKKLREEVNTAILLITHDMGVIAEMSEDVIVMYGGKVMEEANVVQLVKDPKHPYTRGLLASMPSLGMKNQRLNVIAGSVPNPLRLPPGCPFAPRCPHVMDVCATMPDARVLDDGRRVFCWLY